MLTSLDRQMEGMCQLATSKRTRLVTHLCFTVSVSLAVSVPVSLAYVLLLLLGVL